MIKSEKRKLGAKKRKWAVTWDVTSKWDGLCCGAIIFFCFAFSGQKGWDARGKNLRQGLLGWRGNRRDVGWRAGMRAGPLGYTCGNVDVSANSPPASGMDKTLTQK